MTAALSELGARLRTPEGDIVPAPLDADALVNYSTCATRTELFGALDLVFRPDGIPGGFDTLRTGAESMMVGNLRIAVASAESWTLDTLAENVHLSRSQLARASDATVGTSRPPYDCSRATRVEVLLVAVFRDLERRWVNHVINPVVRALLRCGLGPPTYALIETTGRVSGKPRVTPIANGLDGDTFWFFAGLGERASFVRNVLVNPQVRVLAKPTRLRDGWRGHWRSGTAVPLPDDDAWVRQRRLGRGRPLYRLDGLFLRHLADRQEPLTIRVDLH